MASNEGAVEVVKSEEVPKDPVYVTINGTHVVDANVVDKYQIGELVISGFNNLASNTHREFKFSLNK